MIMDRAPDYIKQIDDLMNKTGRHIQTGPELQQIPCKTKSMFRKNEDIIDWKNAHKIEARILEEVEKREWKKQSDGTTIFHTSDLWGTLAKKYGMPSRGAAKALLWPLLYGSNKSLSDYYPETPAPEFHATIFKLNLAAVEGWGASNIFHDAVQVPERGSDVRKKYFEEYYKRRADVIKQTYDEIMFTPAKVTPPAPQGPKPPVHRKPIDPATAAFVAARKNKKAGRPHNPNWIVGDQRIAGTRAPFGPSAWQHASDNIKIKRQRENKR